MPVTEETSSPGGVRSERDAWVQAIDKLCADWKKKYKGEHLQIQPNVGSAEETESGDTGLESNGGFSGGNVTVIYPPAHYANTNPTSGGEDRLSVGATSQSHPSDDNTKPVPKPRSGRKDAGATGPDVSSPTHPAPSPDPQPVSNKAGSAAATGPSLPCAPPPPPLLFKPKTNSSKPCTKAFHWDAVSSEKVTLLLQLHQKTPNYYS